MHHQGRFVRAAVNAMLAVILVVAPVPRPARARQAFQTGEIADGETWFISWSATSSGSSDTTEGDAAVHRTQSISMAGQGTTRYTPGTGWRTSHFQWNITDDRYEKRVSPCGGRSGGSEVRQTWSSITDPTAPPDPRVWDDSFLQPGGVMRREDGSLTMTLWFVHSQAGMPWMPYKEDSRIDWCYDPSVSASSVAESSGYAQAIWVETNSGVLHPLNQPTLRCDGAGTTCSWDYQFTNTSVQPPANAEWHIRARRLPDSPDVHQQLELGANDWFLPGVSLPDRLDAKLTCDRLSTCSATRVQQSPGVAASTTQIGPAPSGSYPTTLDVGTLPPGQTRIVAQANAVPPRPPDTKQVQVADRLPRWVSSPLTFLASKIAGHAQYNAEFAFPEPAVAGEVTVPDFVPFFGGNPIGLKETQASVKAQVLSSGTGQIEGGGQTGFDAAGSAVIGGVTFQMDLTLDGHGLHASNGQFNFKLGGKIEKEQPLLSVIPPLAPAVTAIQSFSPWAAKLLRERANAKLEMEPSFTFMLNLRQDDAGTIVFQNGGAQPAFGIKTSASLDLIKDVLKAVGGVGGQVASTLRAPPLTLQQVQVQLQAFADVIFYRFKWTGGKGYTWTWPSAAGARAAASGGGTASAGWIPAGRGYLAAPDYARWTAPSSGISAQATTGPTQIRLVQNVYPQAGPALVVQSGRRFLTWTHDSAASASGDEIAYSTSPGVGYPWTTQAQVTSDSQDDFNRQLAVTPNGRVVAVWERFDSATPGDPNADGRGYLSHVQIAAARWNGSTWSGAQQLSAGGSLGSRPQLVKTGDGALAVWIGNAANQLVGDAAHPDAISYARYDQASDTWTAPAAMVGSLAGLTDLSLAAGGGAAALVYALDGDGDPTTPADQELYAVQYSDATHAWGTPTRLTTNTASDDAPRLAMTGAGLPQLVWRQDGRLIFLNGTWDASNAAPLALADAAKAADLRLTRGSDGALALTWQQLTGVDTRVGYAIFDPAAQTWSRARSLDPPVAGTVAGSTTMAQGITSALEPGRLLVAYQLAHVDAGTATADDGTTIPNVPRIGSHDLYYAEIPLTRNLTVTPSDVTVTPADAAAGQPVTIAVVVHNTGDLATGATSIALEQTVTHNQLQTRDVPALAGGDSATVTFADAQPAASGSALSVEVDPTRHIAETTDSDNVAALPLRVTATALATDTTALGPRVSAQFQQHGLFQGGVSVTSSLRLDSPTGREVGTAAAVFAADPLQSVTTASVVLAPSVIGAGPHRIYWMPPPSGSVLDDALPLAVSSADVVPSVAAQPESIELGPAGSPSRSISLTVTNVGSAPMSAGVVTVFDRDPSTSGAAALGTIALPTIAPGAVATVTGTLTVPAQASASPGIGAQSATTWPSTLYLRIDPGSPSGTAGQPLTFAVGQLAPGTSGTRIFVPIIPSNAPGG